jgi:hypothetical protein
VITRERFDQIQNDMVENPVYTTLFRDREHFRTMYQHLGYELVFNDKRLESTAVGLRESDIADFFLRPE